MNDFDCMGVFLAVAFYGFMIWFLIWVESPARRKNRTTHTEDRRAQIDWRPSWPPVRSQVIDQILRPTPRENSRSPQRQPYALAEDEDIGRDGQRGRERHSKDRDDLYWVFEGGRQIRAR